MIAYIRGVGTANDFPNSDPSVVMQINQVYATLTSYTDPLFRSMADGLAGLDRT